MAGKQYGRLDSGGVRYPLYMIVGIFVKRILKFVMLAVMLSAITYFGAIATTVSRYIYVNDHGYVYTSTPNTDELNKGTMVVFDGSKRSGDVADSDSILGRLSLAMLPSDSMSVGSIVAGPDGQITYENGMMYVDGHKTGMKATGNMTRKYLSNEYIIHCSYGACKKGSYDILTRNAVDGMVIHHKEHIK